MPTPNPVDLISSSTGRDDENERSLVVRHPPMLVLGVEVRITTVMRGVDGDGGRLGCSLRVMREASV